MRKAFVSDIIHSFCYRCRTARKYPHVIFNEQVSGYGNHDLPDLVPFVSYALNTEPNYILATREIVWMAGWLRTFNAAEQDYALYLLRKYYVRTRYTIADDGESHFC